MGNPFECFDLLWPISINYKCLLPQQHHNFLKFLTFLFFSNIYRIKLENSKKDLFSLSKNIMNDKTFKHD
jgi:hypothetical protein